MRWEFKWVCVGGKEIGRGQLAKEKEGEKCVA